MSTRVTPSNTVSVMWTNNTGSTVNAGVPIVLGTRIGIPAETTYGPSTQYTIPPGLVAMLFIKGSFRVAKTSGESIAVGDNLYWNNSLKVLTLASSGNTYAGWAFENAGVGTTTVLFTMND